MNPPLKWQRSSFLEGHLGKLEADVRQVFTPVYLLHCEMGSFTWDAVTHSNVRVCICTHTYTHAHTKHKKLSGQPGSHYHQWLRSFPYCLKRNLFFQETYTSNKRRNKHMKVKQKSGTEKQHRGKFFALYTSDPGSTHAPHMVLPRVILEPRVSTEHSRIIPGRLEETDGMTGIETRWVVCKTSTLPTILSHITEPVWRNKSLL